MRRKTVVRCIPFLICLFFNFISPAAAMVLSYAATDLSSQEDGLWQIEYHVTDFDAAAYAGFQIVFDFGRYEDIELVESDTTHFDTIIFQPDEIFVGDDGYLDALALQADPSLIGSFIINVHYWDDGFPDSQTFNIYDANFQTVQTGTSSPVPVPGSALLLISGLTGALAIRKRKQPSI